MSGLTRERGDTVIGPRTSQSVLSSLLYREAKGVGLGRSGSRGGAVASGEGLAARYGAFCVAVVVKWQTQGT